MKTSALFDRGRMRWYPRDPVAWWEKTKDLEVEEVGVYDRLMDLMYMHGCPIPDGWGHAGVAVFGLNASKNKAKVWKRIRQKLIDLDFIYVDENGCLAQKRVLEELDSYQKKREQASASGKKGGRKRKEQTLSSAEQSVSSSEQASSKSPASIQQSLSSADKANKINDHTKGCASEPLRGTLKQNIEEEYSVSEAKAPDTSLAATLFADAQSVARRPRADADVDAALDCYCETAKAKGWALPTKNADGSFRKTKAMAKARTRIRALIDDYELSGFKAVVAHCASDRWWSDPSYRRSRGSAWTPCLESLIVADNFAKHHTQAMASGFGEEDDPLVMERWACDKFRSDHRWVGGFNPDVISNTVRAEYPDIFAEVAA